MSDFELVAGTTVLGLRPGDGGHIAYFRSRFETGDFDWMRPAPAENFSPISSACFPMVPFCNRIDQASFTYNGQTVHLPKNFPPEPHAIHGIAWDQPWEIEEKSDHSACLVFRHDGSVWPWAFETRQRFLLSSSSLTITLETVNLSDRPMPSGLGVHPHFLRFDSVEIQAPVAAVIETDAAQMPDKIMSRENEPGGTLAKLLTTGSEFPDGYDHGLEGWDGRAVITWPTQAKRLSMAAVEGYGRAVFYSPMGENFFCFEPVSHTWNAHNRVLAGAGDGGLVHLQPQNHHRVTLEITVEDLTKSD